MDASVELRAKVQKYINTADSMLLRMIAALAMSYQATETESEYTESQKMEMDKRLERYASGENQFYTWEEVESKLDEIN